jgi:O-antigen/teichoic acid export membrane protein
LETQIEKENIRQRAYLNSVTSWIDTIVKLIVRFIIDPLIISFLGGALYGVWQILNQLNNYLATADLRSATALKWIIAKERTVQTEHELKQSVSSSLFTNVLFLPLYLIGGAVIIYISPFVTKVEIDKFMLIRQTSAIMVFSFIVTQFFFLFESVLTGMNLSYKRIGIRAIITVISGILTYLFLKIGLSINGLAIVNVFTAVATGLTFAWIVKKVVPWFGFVKVKIKQVLNFVKLSGWFLADKIVTLLNESIDLILLGYFAGPKFVASYTVSRFVIQAIANLFRSGQGAITPGITRFIGEKQYEKIVYFRKSMIIMNWFVLGFAGTVFILLNKSFVSLWTEQNLFAGFIETFLIVLFILMKSLQTIDGSIITMNLDLKKKILYSAISAILTIVLAAFLIPVWQINGLLLALLIGLLFRIVVFSLLTEKIINTKGLIGDLFFSRLSVITLIILSSSIYFAQQISANNWITLILYGAVTSVVFILIFWFLALNKINRGFISENMKKIKPTKFD